MDNRSLEARKGGRTVKISIAHLPEEQEKAAGTLAALLYLHPGAKVRKSDHHPPFKHIYLTTKKPENPCRDK